MASALLTSQQSLPTAAAKLLECPEPMVPSGTDIRSAEDLDVKCPASEVEQSAAAALLGLCASAAQSTEGSIDSSPESPARDDSGPLQFNTMPGLLNSWDSVSSSSTGSLRPRNSKDGELCSSSMRFRTSFASTTRGPGLLAFVAPLECRHTLFRGFLTTSHCDSPADTGAPPPGSCRFQCRYPGCSKLYASTDAVCAVAHVRA